MNKDILENILTSRSENEQYYQVLSERQKEIIITLANQRKENFLRHLENVQWFEKLDQNQKVMLLEIENVKSNQKETFRRLGTIDTGLDKLENEVNLNQILTIYGKSILSLQIIRKNFMSIERDELGDIKYEYQKEDFLQSTEDLSESMTAVIQMLNGGFALRPESLWEQEGFCERKYLEIFLTELYVAFIVKNFELGLRGFEMSNADAVEFKKDMEDSFIKFVDVCGPENANEYAYKSLILATRKSNSIQDHGKFVQQQLDEKFQESVWNVISMGKNKRNLISTNIYVDDDSLQSMEHDDTFILFWALGERPASVQVNGKSIASREIRAPRSVTIIPPGSQILEELEEKYSGLKEAISNVYANISDLISQLSSKHSALSSKHTALSSEVTGLSNKLSAIPLHIGFSCYRHASMKNRGVFSYSTCTINDNGMMNANTGYVTIPESGEYFLTFYGYMEERDGKGIYVHIRKETGGTTTTLGSTGRDAHRRSGEDQNSTHSLSLIVTLKKGDKIFTQLWKGGTWNLYSSMETDVGFSGFILK